MQLDRFYNHSPQHSQQIFPLGVKRRWQCNSVDNI
nr:MAG TPA: hypothetical protein [Caudoviricetes sp.]